mmetsp:Transcript_91452/g.254691  ORF Transcript_91452/g.254691 Transcript_91452/m.254691 type:complete len:240 (-) Transcript_91452:729-1448(-)
MGGPHPVLAKWTEYGRLASGPRPRSRPNRTTVPQRSPRSGCQPGRGLRRTYLSCSMRPRKRCPHHWRVSLCGATARAGLLRTSLSTPSTRPTWPTRSWTAQRVGHLAHKASSPGGCPHKHCPTVLGQQQPGGHASVGHFRADMKTSVTTATFHMPGRCRTSHCGRPWMIQVAPCTASRICWCAAQCHGGANTRRCKWAPTKATTVRSGSPAAGNHWCTLVSPRMPRSQSPCLSRQPPCL